MPVLNPVAQAQTPAEFFETRTELRHQFLIGNDLRDSNAEIIAEDWAARRYWRIRNGDKTFVMMESAPDDHPLATPGHKIVDTINIGIWLHDIGVHVPEILSANEEHGYVLMEDLGAQVLPLSQDAYSQAAEVLSQIQSAYTENYLNLPAYKGGAVDVNKSRLIRWYLPLSRQQKNGGDEIDCFNALWTEIEAKLPTSKDTFVHIDFHAGNVLWLPEQSGSARCGIVDFQGAHFGSNAYDLVNLLEDIRRDIPKELREHVRSSFCKGMSAHDRAAFDAWYIALQTAFYSRIAGQLIRLYAQKGDTKHLQHLPRVCSVLNELLDRDEFFELREFLNDLDLDLTDMPQIDMAQINAFVDPDF